MLDPIDANAAASSSTPPQPRIRFLLVTQPAVGAKLKSSAMSSACCVLNRESATARLPHDECDAY